MFFVILFKSYYRRRLVFADIDISIHQNHFYSTQIKNFLCVWICNTVHLSSLMYTIYFWDIVPFLELHGILHTQESSADNEMHLIRGNDWRRHFFSFETPTGYRFHIFAFPKFIFRISFSFQDIQYIYSWSQSKENSSLLYWCWNIFIQMYLVLRKFRSSHNIYVYQ